MLVQRIAAVTFVLALAACTESDSDITRRVTTEVAAEAPAEQIKVTTQERVVVLEGVVDNAAERNRLEDRARRVAGVLGVDNRLVVKPSVETTGAPKAGPQKPESASPEQKAPTGPYAP